MRGHGIILPDWQDDIDAAVEFAANAHEGQFRRYTGEPYITHPIAVAKLVLSFSGDVDMAMAAILHDTVEDTDVTIEHLEATFTNRVVNMVIGLTEFSTEEDGNRRVRKALDARYLSRQSAEVQTIKYADLIHNTASIIKHDPSSAKVYMAEKRRLLDVMTRGNRVLRDKARRIIDDYEEAS
jgi:(p)ppGpp synthase/HD superfamily hydrolase